VRDYAAAHGLGSAEALEAGMGEKAAEFRERGGEVYLPVPGGSPADAEEPVAAD
jgi:phosphomethylpyrimidine synthase